MERISRRDFIVSATPAVALAMGASPILAHASEHSWDLEADVVVVGLGGAGCAAAVSALDAGASVIVLEEEAQGGGTTAICGGLVYLGGGTQTQIDAGVEDTVEDMRAYLLASLGASAKEELVNTFCDNSLDNYQWLLDNGVTFEGDYAIEGHWLVAPEGTVLVYSGNERAPEYAAIAKPAPRGHTPNGGGAGITTPLIARIEASENAQVLYETRGVELVQNEEGAVIGVEAVGPDGATILVKANGGVILTAGGFVYNDAMVSNNAPEVLLCAGRTGGPWDRGEGIVMGCKAGASTRAMSRTMLSEFLYQHGNMLHGMLINRDGFRFLAEDWYGSWIGRRVMQTTPEACYVILDAAIMEGVAQGALRAMPDVYATADTIEGLVEQLDVPAENALASIAHYNELVEKGVDSDYEKAPDCLKPIATPPFYAFDARPNNMAFGMTLGGLNINSRAEVLDFDDNPIPGLYAAGRTSCGIYGDYPGSGSSVADGITFGRIAGAQAASR